MPVPPSKARAHPLHDDRVARMLRIIWPGQPADIRDIIIQPESADAAHENPVRPPPSRDRGWVPNRRDPDRSGTGVHRDRRRRADNRGTLPGGELRIGGTLPVCSDRWALHSAPRPRRGSGVLIPLPRD